MEKREQEMSLAEQEEPPVPVEISEFRIEIEGRKIWQMSGSNRKRRKGILKMCQPFVKVVLHTCTGNTLVFCLWSLSLSLVSYEW